jgi:hypothetical protein
MGFPAGPVILILVIGLIGDFAYLYLKIAKTRDLKSGAEAIAAVFIWLVALILMVVLANGLITA